MLINQPHNFSLFNHLCAFNPSTIFMNQPRMLSYWSHSIEKKIVQYGVDTPVYAGFQHLGRFAPVTRQYEKIAQTAPVWVFGKAGQTHLPDTDRLHFMALHPQARLAQEWFVVVNHPDYAHALIAREIAPIQPHQPRQFRGVLTSDRNIIHFASEALASYVQQFTHSRL